MSTQELELSRLEPWLRANVPGFDEPLSAEKFPGGQSNPTFKLTAGEHEYVLRRKPPGELLASAHAVDREYRVLDALRDTDVPVPNAVALCVDDDIIGSMFYVMEHLEGRIFWDPAVPEVDNAERTAIYDEMNRVLAALHSVSVDEVGLSDYGKPGNYYARQIGRWTKQYRASETETVADMEALMEWLPNHIPERRRNRRASARGLPPRQHDLSPDRTPHHWHLGLGAFHARGSAGGPCLPTDGLAIPPRRRHCGPGRP